MEAHNAFSLVLLVNVFLETTAFIVCRYIFLSLPEIMWIYCVAAPGKRSRDILPAGQQDTTANYVYKPKR